MDYYVKISVGRGDIACLNLFYIITVILEEKKSTLD